MRISQEKRDFLIQHIQKILPESKIYLFGSRVNDKARGGDIDILILADRKLSLKEKLGIKRTFWNEFGEQKLDLISMKYDEKSAFRKVALKESCLLT